MANESQSAKSQPAKPQGRLDRFLARALQLLLTVAVLQTALSILLLCGVGVYGYLLDRDGDKTVLSVQGAGQVLRVTQTTGLLTRSLVETDQGFYSLRGGVSLTKAEALTLETRGNQRRYLCDARHRCAQLM